MKTSLVGLLAGLGLSMSVASHGFAQEFAGGNVAEASEAVGDSVSVSEPEVVSETEVASEEKGDSGESDINVVQNDDVGFGSIEVAGECGNGECERDGLDLEVYPSLAPEMVEDLQVYYSTAEVTMSATEQTAIPVLAPERAERNDRDDRVAAVAGADRGERRSPFAKAGCAIGRMFGANNSGSGCSGN